MLCEEMSILKNLCLIMTSRSPCDAHQKVVINRAKFDVCTPSSFKGSGGTRTFRQNRALQQGVPKNVYTLWL